MVPMVTASTNVEGTTLHLGLSATTVVAGDRLPATMIVSNGSKDEIVIPWHMPSPRDTDIGDFVVVNEFGGVLQKVLPDWRLFGEAKGRGTFLKSGESRSFLGDVVWSYSLTNPGTYTVKAVAQVQRDMVIETPAIAITVTPRPEGNPAPALYDDRDRSLFIRPSR